MSLIFVPALYALLLGNHWPILAVIAYFLPFYAGGFLGSFLGRLLNKRVVKRSADFGQRRAGGLIGFGFLFLPPIVWSLANRHLGTEIEMASLWLHFLWACVGGLVFFCAKRTKPAT